MQGSVQGRTGRSGREVVNGEWYSLLGSLWPVSSACGTTPQTFLGSQIFSSNNKIKLLEHPHHPECMGIMWAECWAGLPHCVQDRTAPGGGGRQLETGIQLL